MNAPIVIVRGIPGSGKSTFAKKLQQVVGGKTFETDNFFKDGEFGNYKFDKELLGIAHDWNKAEVLRYVRFNNLPAIVANTFTTNNEMDPYIEIGTRYRRPIYVVTMLTEYKSIHGVPEETIEKMKNRLVKFLASNFHYTDLISGIWEVHDSSEAEGVIELFRSFFVAKN